MCAKQLFLLALFALAAQGVDINQEMVRVARECQALHKVKPEEIVISLTARKLPSSEGAKCFMECVMEVTDVLKDGKFDAERARELSALKLEGNPELLSQTYQIIEKCGTEVSNPGKKCEFGFELANCGIKYAKKLGLKSPIVG